MLIDYQVNNNKHFRQENTSLLMKNCGHDKKNYQTCNVHGYNLNLKIVYSISNVHIQRHPVTMYDTRHMKRI